jgi:hypothetical protein
MVETPGEAYYKVMKALEWYHYTPFGLGVNFLPGVHSLNNPN